VNKEDENFLARVEKEAPELLKTEIDGELFGTLTKRLLDALPHPKQKRMARKRRKSAK
jgi:hypothetical protein